MHSTRADSLELVRAARHIGVGWHRRNGPHRKPRSITRPPVRRLLSSPAPNS